LFRVMLLPCRLGQKIARDWELQRLNYVLAAC